MIAIYGADRQEEHLAQLGRFFESLAGSGLEICVHTQFADYLLSVGIVAGGFRRVDSLPDDTRLVVSLGGDGTFLRASSWAGRDIPVMGINTGHLGYLAAFSLDKPQEVEAALRGDFDVSRRMTVELECDALPAGFSPVALNEISILKGDTTSMVSISARLDGYYLADYLADGLLVATPTGSTAYNLSCGGPILEPIVESIILTPIAPHSLTLRPLVVGAASRIELEVTTRGESCHIGVDGRTFAVPSGARLLVRRGRYMVSVAQPRSANFAETLRRKLRWGARN